MARRRSRVPGSLRPLIGGAVLVGTVRLVDVLWTRLSGRRPPLADGSSETGGGEAGGAMGRAATESAAADDASPRAVRDRLLYALLLGGALRMARRAGLPDDDAQDRTAGSSPDV
jgi:hypothetical protein